MAANKYEHGYERSSAAQGESGDDVRAFGHLAGGHKPIAAAHATRLEDRPALSVAGVAGM
jgi:hypothetical protein